MLFPGEQIDDRKATPESNEAKLFVPPHRLEYTLAAYPS